MVVKSFLLFTTIDRGVDEKVALWRQTAFFHATNPQCRGHYNNSMNYG